MTAAPLNIHVLSDGKPGHRNQSLGLAEALGRLTPVAIHEIPLAGAGNAFSRMRLALAGLRGLPQPDLILGAGHAVHLSLILLARKSGAPSVLLMKPSLPSFLFDLCLVPAHDLKGEEAAASPHIVSTRGALNRVPLPSSGPRSGKLILIGGPSAAHGWDGSALSGMLEEIVTAPGWVATDSRRTPHGFLEAAAQKLPGMKAFPHAETTPQWLPSQLAAAEEVWVTADSVSMIYEALSSGARVGLLPVPLKKRHSRVARGVEQLADEGFLTRYEAWQPGTPLSEPPLVLRESDRCARIVLKRFFDELLPV